ncbi:hypothetical protein HYT17_02250 [Candidatus Microgenomates bacterium]|nr:hypothetical protein [Candidatus Microgenomates bacterium]
MQERGSKLGITQEVVDGTLKKVEPHANTMDIYVRSVIFRMSQEQPLLAAFLQKIEIDGNVSNVLVYNLGATLTYDMLTQSFTGEKRKRQITPELLGVVIQNFKDHFVKTGFNMTWFNDKLQEDSPAFKKLLDDFVFGLEDNNAKSDFTLGAYLVAMPFYMMAEAEELEQSIFGIDQ